MCPAENLSQNRFKRLIFFSTAEIGGTELFERESFVLVKHFAVFVSPLSLFGSLTLSEGGDILCRAARSFYVSADGKGSLLPLTCHLFFIPVILFNPVQLSVIRY